MKTHILFIALFSSVLAAQPGPSLGQSASTTSPSGDMSQGTTNGFILPEATPVKLKLLHSLTSKTVVEGDPLNFVLAEDVVINQKVLVKAGAAAIGRVRQAKPARMLGRAGQLGLEMQYLKVGPTRVPLRGSQARSGEAKKGETVALVALFGLSGLVKHGSEVEVKEGSIFTAYVDQDTNLPSQEETVVP